MGNFIRKVNIESKQGECNIHLSLEININLNQQNIEVNTRLIEEKEEDSLIMPEFSSEEKVKFGRLGE